MLDEFLLPHVITTCNTSGYTLRDYAIGFMAFGTTVREWFVNQNITQPMTEASDGLASFGNMWSALGNQYLKTRLEIEQSYCVKF